MRIQSIVTLASLVCIVTSFGLEAVQFVDCGSKRGQLINVTVTPCDTTPCSLYHENVTTGRAYVHGIIAGIPIPFSLDDNDLCKFTKPPCEISAQAEAVYTYALPIKSYYPKWHIKVRWELKDANRRDIICALIRVKIADRR
ncbi:hypothetical protein FGIG_01931 [Fasciola gigantica]|uniref:MD-2-related lipid-recognition domain-containing protein n=1 Tax=Fasciola gigantica TaxID=46835 RepID=A0A504Z159_FASGI|nr:hypothetical protein FGIG_01931 [Fasciola gigantica]